MREACCKVCLVLLKDRQNESFFCHLDAAHEHVDEWPNDILNTRYRDMPAGCDVLP